MVSLRLLPRRADTPAVPLSSGYSLLDSRIVVSGDLETSGSLRIDGRMTGSVLGADTVVVGAGASLTGDIAAREVIVGGTVTGNVSATERVELQATAIVTGDIATQTVLVQEGGVVNGRVLMQPPVAPSSVAKGGEKADTVDKQGQRT